uniref:Uncharacterized protein n=1 Tax=Knipowitschia caucasica TaxID=637954 RepID=A0AAV2KLH4_KNICA
MKRLVQRGRWFLPEKNDQPLSRPFPYTHEQAPPTIGGIAPSSSLTANFLIRALMKLVNEQQNNWDTFLDATLFSLRSKVHISTKHTPFQLMYGREAVFPSEVPVDYPQVGDHDCHPLQDTLLWRAASIHQDTAKCDSYTPMELESEKALDIQTEQSNEGMPHWAVFIQSSNPKYNKGKQTAKPTLEADQDRKPTHWPSGSVNSSRILSTSHAGMTWLPVVPSTS